MHAIEFRRAVLASPVTENMPRAAAIPEASEYCIVVAIACRSDSLLSTANVAGTLCQQSGLCEALVSEPNTKRPVKTWLQSEMVDGRYSYFNISTR